jgi:single-strand DNA-binding protein
MNKSMLIGRLTKDVELKNTAGGTAVANFTLAVNRKFKQEGQPTADFIPVVVWGKSAEFCQKYFAKGQQVYVVGRIQTRSWEDAEGKKHYATEVVGEEVGFADSKKGDGGENGSSENGFIAQNEDSLPF